MELEIKDGKVIIDPIDILSELSGDDKIQVIEALSCESEVIQHVTDQIIHGCTENGWHGSIGFSSKPSTPLEKAIREITESSSDIAKKEIEKMKRIVKSKEDSADRAWEQYRKLRDSLRTSDCYK